MERGGRGGGFVSRKDGERNSEDLLSGAGATEALLSPGRETFRNFGNFRSTCIQKKKTSKSGAGMGTRREKRDKNCVCCEDFREFF